MSRPEYTLFGLFQDLLLVSQPDFKRFFKEVSNAKEATQGVPLAKCRILERAGLVYEAFELTGKAGSRDLAIMLRQVNRLFEQYIDVRKELWELIEPVAKSMSMQVRPNELDDTIRLIASSWIPRWLTDHAGGIDALESRRFSTAALADGNLYSMTGYRTYKSEAQRTAVNVAMFASPGSTTLITLPTGEGKSLCVLLPAWVESNAGRRDNGTTIVVVPTISLAQDQTAAARKWFSKARMQPAALTGFTSREEKRRLYQGVREGSLPIIYTSPEALLMNSWLYDACQQSATAGKLTRFVIDEVHLVDTWGAEFRPEFQLMGAFCMQLRKRTDGKMVTLLLSATVTNETEQVLQQTFTPDGELQTVIGNRLRPEPSYWFSHVSSKAEQQYRVLDALNHLPRPAILYVTLKKDADEWQNVLVRHGYKRVAVYTGDTTGVERERILNGWRNNQIDIMIGNSAFGVGVDKPDIRTVIHATAPDNMDRFYQEVGRGGRDGNSSISLVVTKDEDYKQARHNRAKLIGEDIGWTRWQGMWRDREGVSGEEFILSMTVPPIDKPVMGNNARNRQWNQRTLLLLQRCGLLSIVDSSPKKIEKENESRQDNSEEELFVQVRIFNEKALTDEERFKVIVAEQRRVELDTANQQINILAETLRQTAKGKMKRCVGRSLATLYPFATYLCGGCPVCRENNSTTFTKKDVHIHLDIEPITPRYELSRNLEAAFRGRQTALVLCANAGFDEWLGKLIPLLVRNGIEQIVTPEPTISANPSRFDEMYTKLGTPDLRYVRHRLVASPPLLNGQDELFGLPTAVFYSSENDQIDELFGFVKKEFDRFDLPYPLLHIIPRNAELQRLGGLMRDKVNATRLDIDDLVEQLNPKQSQMFYR